jgi:hypothetical protein
MHLDETCIPLRDPSFTLRADIISKHLHPVPVQYKYLLVSLTEISDIHTSSCSHESMALPENIQFQITYKCTTIMCTNVDVWV